MAKTHTIGNVTAGMMIVLALIVDGLQVLLTMSVLLIPLSLLLTFVAATGFMLWFLILGAYSGKGAEKKLLTSAVATVAEIIPLVNAIPAVTASVIINILLSRAGDLKQQGGLDPKKQAALARLQRMHAARAKRTDSMRASREEDQDARHTPANDNRPSDQAREAA